MKAYKKILSTMMAGLIAVNTLACFDNTTLAGTGTGNLLLGGNFDQQSDLSNWSTGNTKTFVSGGADNSAGCVKLVPAPGGYISMSQNVTMSREKWYLIKAKVKLETVTAGAANTTNAKFMLLADGKSYCGENFGYTTANSDGWTEIYTMFKNIGDNSYSTYSLQVRVGQNDITKVANGAYIDDVSVEAIDYDKIVVNGSFENKYAVYGNSCSTANDKWSNSTTFRIDPWLRFNYGYITNNPTDAQIPTWIAPGSVQNNGNETAYIKVLPVTGSMLSVSQEIKLDKDKWYLISARVKLLPRQDGTAATTAKFYFTGTTGTFPSTGIGVTNVSSEKWTTVNSYYKYIGSGANSNCTLQLRIGQNDVANVANGAYIDDVMVSEVDTTKVINGGFETVTDYIVPTSEYVLSPWAKSGNPTISFDNTVAYNGNSSMKVVKTGVTDFLEQSFKFTQDKLYKIGTYVKLASLPQLSEGQKVKYGLYTNAATEPLSEGTIENADWNYIRSYYQSSNSESMSVRLSVVNADNSVDTAKSKSLIYYMDDFDISVSNSVVTNGDFEFNADKWTCDNGAITTVKDLENGSMRVAKIEAADEQNALSQSVKPIVGSNLISFDVKGEATGGELWVELNDDSGNITTLGDHITLDQNWHSVSIYFNNSTDVLKNLVFKVNGSIVYYLDNVAVNEYKPSAQSINLSGLVLTGRTVNGTFEFNSKEGLPNEGISTYSWLVGDSENGTTWNEVKTGTMSSADIINFTISNEYVNKYLKFRVSPCDEYGVTGAPIESASYKIKMPVEFNSSITGNLTPGTLLQPNVVVKNNTDEDVIITVMLVLFDNTGRMADIACQKKTISDFSQDTFTKGFTLPDNVTNYSARVLLWKGTETGLTDMTVANDYFELK